MWRIRAARFACLVVDVSVSPELCRGSGSDIRLVRLKAHLQARICAIRRSLVVAAADGRSQI